MASERKSAKAVISGDPVATVGAQFRAAILPPFFSDADETVDTVDNWGLLSGAVVAICLNDECSTRIVGTAFFVAPGVLISASHVLIQLESDLRNDALLAFCVGIRDDEAQYWLIRHIHRNSGDDICILSVEARSPIPRDKTYYQFPLSTRAPRNQTEIHLLGFREGDTVPEDQHTLCANMLLSKGRVTAVYPQRHELPHLPFPTIEIAAGTRGGKSGGAAFLPSGHIIGVIARGWETEDRRGPTYVSWIIPALVRQVELSWPRGLYKSNQSILDLDPLIARVEGADRISMNAQILNYRVWY